MLNPLYSLFDSLRKIDRHMGVALLSSGIKLAYETFGQALHPVFLLIMGTGGQRIFWPTEFCEKLAGKGFYVIRYDLRDSGESSYIDYDIAPYDLFDLAQDALGLMDALNLQKVHLLGLSMGSAVAEFLAVHAPERLISLSLMGAPADFEPIYQALLGQEVQRYDLSGPKKQYLEQIAQTHKLDHAASFEERLERRISFWQMLNGSVYPFENTFLRALQTAFLRREKNRNSVLHYRLAIAKSKDKFKHLHTLITLPTLIFHGSEDPLFGLDHQKALQQTIKNSTLLMVVGLGHLPNPRFFSFITQMLAKHAEELPLKG